MTTGWTGVRHFIVLSLISSHALASSVMFCDDLFQTRAGALIVSPQQRAVVEFQSNQKYLAHGQKGAEAFLQMALYKTNDDLRSIGRAITLQNMSPHRVGDEVSVEQQAAKVSANLSAIQELAVAARKKDRWYTGVLGGNNQAIAVNNLKVAIEHFFNHDMEGLAKFEDNRQAALQSIHEEEAATEAQLHRVLEEKHYLKSLIDRLNQARHDHALATDIDVHIDLELTEKLRVIAEYEVTFEQAILKLQLREANLIKSKIAVDQLRARLPVTAAQVPEFMTRLRSFEQNLEYREIARQRAEALAKRRAAIYAKNEPRRSLAVELRAKREARFKRIDDVWKSVKVGDTVFIRDGASIVKAIIQDRESLGYVTVGGTLQSQRIAIAKLILSEVPDGLFKLPIGTYVSSKKGKTGGRITGYSADGQMLIDEPFAYALGPATDYAVASDLVQKTLRGYFETVERIGGEWSKVSSSDAYAMLGKDQTITKVRILTIEGDRISIATDKGTDTVDAKLVALANVASRAELPFKLNAAVTNGKRLARIIAYYKNGIALVKTLPSERSGDGKFENWTTDRILAAKLPAPDHAIGSTVEATKWIYECEVRTTYKILAFDPESNSYQVQAVTDYASGSLDSHKQNYYGYGFINLSRGDKGTYWLKAGELKNIIQEVLYDRKDERRQEQFY